MSGKIHTIQLTFYLSIKARRCKCDYSDSRESKQLFIVSFAGLGRGLVGLGLPAFILPGEYAQRPIYSPICNQGERRSLGRTGNTIKLTPLAAKR